MQNKIILLLIFLPLLVSFVSAKDPYQNIKTLLEKAEALKQAENYQAAEELYDEVLKMDPDNKEALKGKDDCRIMLEPLIPIQHLGVPHLPDDPEYQQLIKQANEAKTPWDKRRAEIAFERFAVRYTGKVFGEQKKVWEKRIDKVIDRAVKRLKNGVPVEVVYTDSLKELRQLQASAHRSWKGHGPEFLEAATKKLQDALILGSD